jgi:hypothetical protein
MPMARTLISPRETGGGDREAGRGAGASKILTFKRAWRLRGESGCMASVLDEED